MILWWKVDSILQSQFSVGGGVEFGFDDESSHRIAFPISSISSHRNKNHRVKREREKDSSKRLIRKKKEILMKKK